MTQSSQGVQPLAIVLLIGLLLSGCGDNPREPVQITLCKQLLINHNSPQTAPEWSRPQLQAQRYDGLKVTVSYPAIGQQRAAQAVCEYPYDAVEEDASHDAQPLSVYATNPSNITFNGIAVTDTAIDRLVEKAMIAQGKAFAERLNKAATDEQKDAR